MNKKYILAPMGCGVEEGHPEMAQPTKKIFLKIKPGGASDDYAKAGAKIPFAATIELPDGSAGS